MNNIYIRYLSMPPTVRGFVKEDAEGDYNVYLRKEDSTEVQRETYLHELAHIRGYHLQAEEWTPFLEEEAEQGINGEQGKENQSGELAGPSVRLHGRQRKEARPELYGPDESASGA
ncbi:MAG: hypothetical protein IJG87_02230 [Ruminococcus sp.]|nr:hypothetical protein [Ruminococcus sp.]